MGKKNKQLFKRLGLFVIGGVLLASSFVGLLPESASAKKINAMTVAEEASSTSYYTALSWCMTNSMRGEIETRFGDNGDPDPDKASWFSNGNGDIYVFNGTATSKKTCNAIIGPALELWGWGTDYRQFLRDMKYSFNNDPETPKWTRSDKSGSSIASTFWSIVQSKAYTTNFNLTLPGYYVGKYQGWQAPMSVQAEYLLLSQLFATCKIKPLGLYPDGIKDAGVKALVQNRDIKDGTSYTYAKWLNSDGVSAYYGLSYESTGPHTIYGDLYSGYKLRCESIIDRVDTISPAVALAGAMKGCEEAGVLDLFSGAAPQPILEGCGNGVLNKTPFDYCAGKYPSNTNQRKACYFGQGSEAGEACVLNGFASSILFMACINGSKNPVETRPTYCADTYQDRASPGSGAVFSRADERLACTEGQKIKISSNNPPVPTVFGTANCSVDPTATGCEDSPTQCAIAGLGWLICPVVNFLAGLGDSAYNALSDNFLETNIKLVEASPDNGTYVAWGMVRSLANVGFVIIFLVIIFSQLTGAGISNYGVKKMLPRLVIGVILVNASFTICQLSVDVANIVGSSIKDVFDGIASQVNLSYDREDPIGSVTGDSGSLLGAFGTILSIGGVGIGGYFLLSAGGTFLIAGLIGLLVTLLILILRQVIIVLGIIVSPLVFIAWILPNTQNLFKQWLKIFSSMLLVFPIVSLIFGGAILASAVIGRVAVDQDDMLWQIIAALLPAVSMLAVIPVLQGAIKAVPAIGQLATKMAGRANANFGKKANESYQGSVIGRGRAIRKQEMNNFRARKFAERVENGGVTSVMAGGLSSLGITESQRAQKEAVRRAASGTAATAQSEAVKQQMKVLQDKVGTRPSDIARHIENNHTTMSDTDMQAATDLLLASEGTGDLRRIVSNPAIMQRHARSIAESGRRNDTIVRKKSRDLANWFSTQDATVGGAYTDQMVQETYTGAQASKLLTLDKESAEIAEQHIDPTEAVRALKDQNAGQLDPATRRVLERRSALAPPPPPTGTP